MNLHVLQHVPWEGPALIGEWARARGHSLGWTRWFAPDAAATLPDDPDGLVVMGGPMGVGDAGTHPWLEPEISYLREAVAAGVPTLGICLGAQLMARACGATVSANPVEEIGWFPVERHPMAASQPLLEPFPERFDAFHWHGDTFAIPDGAVPLGSSERCANQGFALGRTALALQFHLELRASDLQGLEAGGQLESDALPERPSLAPPAVFATSAALMEAILERLFEGRPS